MKSQHAGEGLACSASRGVGRFPVLVLIASSAAILLSPVSGDFSFCIYPVRLRS